MRRPPTGDVPWHREHEARKVAFFPDREHGRVDIGVAANGGRVGQSGGYLCDDLGAGGGDFALVDLAVRA